MGQTNIINPDVEDKNLPTTRIFGLAAPSATPAWALGSKIYDPIGDTTYQYVQASGSIAAKAACSKTTTTGKFEVAQTAATTVGVAEFVGVNPNQNGAITTGQYFWMACQGRVNATVTGTVTIGDNLAPDVGASGALITAAVTTPTAAEVTRAMAICGVALTANSGGAADVYLRHRT